MPSNLKKDSASEKGARGEKIFGIEMTKYIKLNNLGRLFYDPIFLGEKNETLDFLVNLKFDRKGHSYLFVQVKTTRGKYNKHKNRIVTPLSKATVLKLIKVPAPTYLASVDESNHKVYLISVNGEFKKGLSSVPIKYRTTETNLIKLHKEVKEYWSSRYDKSSLKSKFKI